MMYGAKTGYTLTWKSNISQTGSLVKGVVVYGRLCFPFFSLLSWSRGHYSRWWTASSIKNQFQDQLRLRQVITGSGCNSSKRFEKERVGKCRDLSMFHYSRRVYGLGIDLSLRFSSFFVSHSFFFLLSTSSFTIRDQRERNPFSPVPYLRAIRKRSGSMENRSYSILRIFVV